MQEADHHGDDRYPLAILGDFSGRERSGASPLPTIAGREPLWITAGDVNAALRELRPRVRLRATSEAVTLEFASLEDFRPEALLRQLHVSSRSDSGELARRALHDPAVQALESLWRGVALLAARLRSSAAILAIVDVTDTEVEHALAIEGDGDRNGVARVLRVAATELGATIPLVLWLTEHAATPAHLLRLRGIARLAAQERFAVVTAAHPSLAALAATEPELTGQAGRLWRELRCAAEAEHLQLLMPRFLLRAPYDAPIVPFTNGKSFRELPAESDLATVHSRLLWGNPALLAGIVLGSGGTSADLSVGGLPTFTVNGDRDVRLPCSESLLAEESALQLISSGVTPLICNAGEDSVRLTALQSVSAGGAQLRVHGLGAMSGAGSGPSPS